MRFDVSVISAFVVVIVVALAGEDQANPKPQGMTLRLELFVSDMEKSIDFYTKVLGFERLKGEPDYVPVRSGSVLIGLGPSSKLQKMHYFSPELQTSRRGLGAEIVLEVDDVEGFFQKVKATGYKRILSPLRKQSWGSTDFRIADPDGYYLRITSR
jgi:lactoylglutathione lyase